MDLTSGLIAVGAILGVVAVITVVVLVVAPLLRPLHKYAGPFWGAIHLHGPDYQLTVAASRNSASLKPIGALPGRLLMNSRPSLEWTGAMSKVSIDADVDALYDVRAVPAAFARSVFNAETMSRLRALGRRGSLRLLVSPTVVSIGIEAMPDEAERGRWTEDLTEAVIEVFHAARAGGLAGVVEEPGRCPVCGTELSSKVVRCAKCATPHHGECWTFNGRCATYACGGVEGRA